MAYTIYIIKMRICMDSFNIVKAIRLYTTLVFCLLELFTLPNSSLGVSVNEFRASAAVSLQPESKLHIIL